MTFNRLMIRYSIISYIYCILCTLSNFLSFLIYKIVIFVFCLFFFFFSSRGRHTMCSLVTGVQTCALPICVTDLGGTMRLGAYVAQLEPGSRVAEAYGSTVVSERHRHRYEFNSRYRARFEDSSFRCSGTSPDGRLVEFIELTDPPLWVGTQAHPAPKRRPHRPGLGRATCGERGGNQLENQ